MLRKKLIEKYPQEMEIYKKDEDVNPLEVFEQYYFKQKSCKDYRESAINKCIKEKEDFTSTTNSLFRIAKHFIRITCPTCKKEMKPCGGYGNGTMATINYNCDCGNALQLSMPQNGISISFKD